MCRRRCTRKSCAAPTPVHAQTLGGGAIDQHAANRANATVDKAIEAGIMFAGTPDQVFHQIKQMYDHVGGFGHLLIMGQAGFLEHDETVRGIKTFAREVYPRLKEAFPDTAVSGMRQEALAARVVAERRFVGPPVMSDEHDGRSPRGTR